MSVPSTSPATPDWPTKLAPTVSPVHNLIRRRWSPRAFGDHPVTTRELTSLFEAASWAASSGNAQPWVFIYAHRADETNFQRLLSCLNQANQTWAQHAAVLVLALARTTLPNGKPNAWARHDVGSATTTMLLQATAEGLYGHVMAGFDAEKVRQEFHLPPDIEPVTFTSLGHLGAPDQLDEPNRSREIAPRTRKSVSEIAFAGDFPTV